MIDRKWASSWSRVMTDAVSASKVSEKGQIRTCWPAVISSVSPARSSVVSANDRWSRQAPAMCSGAVHSGACAVMASRIVSRSRISPTRMTSGS